MLRGTSEPWTVTDRILGIAYTLSQDLICSGCGQPKHESWNPDSDGYFEIREADCQGCAMLAKDNEAHKDRPDPARKVWTISTRTPDDPPLRPWQPN
jgi:hypothetical protein